MTLSEVHVQGIDTLSSSKFFLTLWIVKSLNIFLYLMQHLIVTGWIVVKYDFPRKSPPFPERRLPQMAKEDTRNR